MTLPSTGKCLSRPSGVDVGSRAERVVLIHSSLNDSHSFRHSVGNRNAFECERNVWFPIQSGKTKQATPALSQVIPNNVSGLPRYIVRGYSIQYLCNATGTTEILSPYCPGQCGYNVSALPPRWGAVRLQCLHIVPQMSGSAETLYPHYPGQYGDIVWGNP